MKTDGAQNIPPVSESRESWITPEITSYDVAETTLSATFNPGDGLSSNS